MLLFFKFDSVSLLLAETTWAEVADNAITGLVVLGYFVLMGFVLKWMMK